MALDASGERHRPASRMSSSLHSNTFSRCVIPNAHIGCGGRAAEGANSAHFRFAPTCVRPALCGGDILGVQSQRPPPVACTVIPTQEFAHLQVPADNLKGMWLPKQINSNCLTAETEACRLGQEVCVFSQRYRCFPLHHMLPNSSFINPCSQSNSPSL